MEQGNRKLPLNGIRVMELGHTVMGPTCGLVLADMGAEVIKIERAPNGDDTRRLTGFGSGFFPYFNRNKKSLVIDLKSDKGKEILKKIVMTSDVFIENFAPGAVDRLGFSYDEVYKINPQIIYCSLKGFMKGPYENRPALDEVVQMMGGLAYMTGPPGRPLRAGTSITDITGGIFGVIGILTALYERQKTGKGQYLQAALFESVAFLVGQHMAYCALSKKPTSPMPARVSAWAIYHLFESKDGEMIFVGVTSDILWKRFCDTFGLSSLYADERLSTNNKRVAETEWLIPQIRKIFKEMEKAEIIRLCEKANIPFSPIARPDDLFDDLQLNQGEGLVEATLPDGTKTKLPKIPLRIGSYDFGLRNDAPRIGEGTQEVLKSIGLPEEEIAELKKTGIVVSDF